MTDADQERGWRESAEAAEAFFQLVGQATVAERLANIASTARAVLHALKTGAHTHAPAAINRWAVRHLDLCSRTFHRPPPPELVALVAHQLRADKPERSGRKNRPKFVAAAHHIDDFPVSKITLGNSFATATVVPSEDPESTTMTLIFVGWS